MGADPAGPTVKTSGKKKKLRWKTALLGLTAIVFLIALCLCTSPIFDGERERSAGRTRHSAPSRRSKRTSSPRGAAIKVMTLNLAHGRKDKAAQFFKGADAVRRNLDDVAAVLRREAPDLVALQEADGPSIWSGSFNHVTYLAEAAGYAYSARGAHVDGPGLSYGTALLSRLRLEQAVSISFEPSWPTFTKGMVVGTLQCAEDGTCPVDVVSAHLDFSRDSVRRKQLDEMAEKLAPRNRPLIVMGDFNCAWDDGEAMLAKFAGRLALKAYLPLAGGLETHSLLGKRIDWILISRDLEFEDYGNLPDILSDHRAVQTVVRIPSAGG